MCRARSADRNRLDRRRIGPPGGPRRGWPQTRPAPPSSDPRLLRDVHAQVQAVLLELGADLLEGGLAEVADAQELLLGAADQVADGGDALALQAVGGADRQLELGEAHVELALELL